MITQLITMSRVVVCTVLALLSTTPCALVDAAVAADKITSLPGWDGALPSPQYSGYLDAGEIVRCVSICRLRRHARHQTHVRLTLS